MDIPYVGFKGYLELGFNDYLAARTLLINEMLLQGACMASTSIEKYVKAYSISQGHPANKLHIGPKFIPELKSGPGIPPYLSENFLTFLGNCYALRYFDTIEAGFNLHIRQRQLLAELDEVVSTFEGAFTLKQNGTPILTASQQAIRDKAPLVAMNNWVVNGQDKTEFIEQTEAVYEIRFLSPMNPIQVTYYTETAKNDGNFLKPALVPDGPNELQAASLPMRPAS